MKDIESHCFQYPSNNNNVARVQQFFNVFE